MSQVTEQSVRFQTALASIKLIQASAVLDLTEDDFDFLTSNKVWIATDRSRARRCVEACGYGTLGLLGYPRLPSPVEFISALTSSYFQQEQENEGILQNPTYHKSKTSIGKTGQQGRRDRRPNA